MIRTCAVTWQNTIQIMECNTSKLWDIYWCNKKGMTKKKNNNNNNNKSNHLFSHQDLEDHWFLRYLSPGKVQLDDAIQGVNAHH